MRLWRVESLRHLGQSLSGEGGLRASGRWNSQGRRIIYASENQALAALEAAVNRRSVEYVVTGARLVAIDVPDALVADLTQALPAGWRSFPHPPVLQTIGDAWLQSALSVALRVPSAVVEGNNILLNPAHPDFNQVTLPGLVADVANAQDR